MSTTGTRFEKLVAIMRRLRAPDGCPWDREQTYENIAAHTLEETYEVLETIDRKDYAALREELGDLLLQVLFYAQIAADDGRFTIDDVVEAISKKLVHRHPHVFGDETARTSADVTERWEELKKAEGKKTVLGGVPAGLPALLAAFRLGEKTSRVGFDWPDAEGILDKVEEEAKELHEARRDGSDDDIDREYGDLLFTLANLGRFLKRDPEGALRRANGRFKQRFSWMEEQLSADGRRMQDLSAEEWDTLWNRAKDATKRES